MGSNPTPAIFLIFQFFDLGFTNFRKYERQLLLELCHLGRRVMEITGKELIEAVRGLADENPDFMYQPFNSRCYYTKGRNDTPGCIIGQALLKLDPGLEIELTNTDREGIIPGVSDLIDALQIEAHKPDRIWLEVVQGRQDLGSNWGKAVAYADTFLKDYP